MKSTGRACSLLLLTMAAVSSGRNAREYFQQARFQHSPSRPEDALVFFTAAAPPLVCELEMNGDWIGGDRLKADLILSVEGASLYYTCSFEGNATTDTNLKLIQQSLGDVFISTGKRKIRFSDDKMYCTADSQLPDEYFHLRVQRPNEDSVVKCRLHTSDGKLYLRFPGFPTITCKMGYLTSDYRFNLPGIAGDPFACGFLVFLEMRLVKTQTEERLYQSLINGLPSRTEGGRPPVVCSPHATLNRTTNFQLLLPGGSTYDCNFDDDHDPPFPNIRNDSGGAITDFEVALGDY